jgi:hypothetical protein
VEKSDGKGRAKGDEFETQRVVKKLSEEYVDRQIDYSTELEPDDRKTLSVSFRRDGLEGRMRAMTVDDRVDLAV